MRPGSGQYSAHFPKVVVAATVVAGDKGGHLPSAFSSLLSFVDVSLELKMGDQLSNQNMISAVVVVDYYDRYY